MAWLHNYTPFGGVILSALAAALPFLLLCWQLLIRRSKGHVAALTAFAGAFVLAVAVWDMPLKLAVNASLYGMAFGAFPILWIILTAMWVYAMTVDAGQFLIVRDSISALTDDRRIQAIFIAFAFGALLESTAGYGSPVAIGAAMLIGLGFPPIKAAVLCLVANTVPVAFAGLGLPALVAGQVSELDAFRVTQVIGRQLPLLAMFVPLWLSVLVCGWRRSWEIWPVLLAGGLGSAVPTFIFANYHGYTLPGIMGAVGSLAAIAGVMRVWRPATPYYFDGQPVAATPPLPPAGQVLRAWMPWIVLTGLVMLSSLGPVRAALNSLLYAHIAWPGLHQVVCRVAPLADAPTPLPAWYTLNLASSPGTIILLTGLLLPLIMPGYSYARAGQVFVRTVVQMRFSILTIVIILALAQLMNYSGMSYTLGLAFTLTGTLFALFAPILGWIGVFLTGSDTSSNALFCGMQRATAEAVGLNPYLAVAANTTGGVTAKMISPQSIAVAVGATGLAGQEGALLGAAIWQSLLMLGMVCVLTWLQSGLLAFML